VYFRSRDKDGGQTNRFAIAENPTLHANYTVLSSTEPELSPIKKFYIARNGNFTIFCSSDLYLDPMTFIMNLCTNRLKMNFLCQGC